MADGHSIVKDVSGPAKRTYDATSRRARAEEERAETRRRVVEAARRLFLEKGYVATTMADIRKEAGVAIQSVYNAGRSKADLLHLVNDIAVELAANRSVVVVDDLPGGEMAKALVCTRLISMPEIGMSSSESRSTK